MSVRAKLNVAYFNGCLFVAAFLGLASSSWVVFWIALAVTVACGVHGGEIRLSAGKR